MIGTKPDFVLLKNRPRYVLPKNIFEAISLIGVL